MVKKEIRKREKRGGVWWETVEKKIKEREYMWCLPLAHLRFSNFLGAEGAVVTSSVPRNGSLGAGEAITPLEMHFQSHPPLKIFLYFFEILFK